MEIISNRVYTPEYFKGILDTLNTWTEFINEKKNFSFIKIGDGELISMSGPASFAQWGDKNCDAHPFDVCGLSQKINDAWLFFNETYKESPIYIGEWVWGPWCDYMRELVKRTNIGVNFVNFEILLQNTLCQEKYDFFKSIKDSKRNKIFVGPKRLHHGVSRFLNIDTLIEVPLDGVIYKYDEILSKIKENLVKDSVLLFSCSIPSKSLIHKTLEIEPQVTCLDIGSGFDAMFHGYTREGQFRGDIIRKYYSELL